MSVLIGRQHRQPAVVVRHGNSAVTAVPAPGGLDTLRRPSSASTRSASPRSPEPHAGSAPPTPSSVISITTPVSVRNRLTLAADAWAYLTTLANASDATKYAAKATGSGSRGPGS